MAKKNNVDFSLVFGYTLLSLLIISLILAVGFLLYNLGVESHNFIYDRGYDEGYSNGYYVGLGSHKDIKEPIEKEKIEKSITNKELRLFCQLKHPNAEIIDIANLDLIGSYWCMYKDPEIGERRIHYPRSKVYEVLR